MNVSDATIEQQHLMFVQKIEQFKQAINDNQSDAEINRMYNFMRDYAKYHFIEEEKLMAEAKYPKLTQHVAMHDDFVSRLIEMKIKLDSNGATQELYIELVNFVENWHEQHINGADKDFFMYQTNL